MLKGNSGGAPVWALGLMSGTSLDGVDGALLLTDGVRIEAFGQGDYRAYAPDEQAALRGALGLWQAPAEVTELLHRTHADLAKGLARDFAGTEVVGFHGQTLAHDPGGRGTHQAGDGAALARELGLPVVWDFRSNDVQMGGQGAPLAPFFHFACARWIGVEAPMAFLNLGGVGNLTWVDPRAAGPEAPGALLAFDTGPANAPLNDLMMARFGVPYDKDGALARRGQPDGGVLARFLAQGYFRKLPPKSLDRDAWGGLVADVAGLADADAAATLVAAVAASVAAGMEHLPVMPAEVLVTGGGRHNLAMMEMLADVLDCPVRPVEAVGLDGDLLEAQAFAFLAVRVMRGLPTSAPGTTGVAAAVGGGKISRP